MIFKGVKVRSRTMSANKSKVIKCARCEIVLGTYDSEGQVEYIRKYTRLKLEGRTYTVCTESRSGVLSHVASFNDLPKGDHERIHQLSWYHRNYEVHKIV